MFGMLESLAKAATAVITIPVAVVADVVTLGGVAIEKDQPYTINAISDFMENLNDVTRPEKK